MRNRPPSTDISGMARLITLRLRSPFSVFYASYTRQLHTLQLAPALLALCWECLALQRNNGKGRGGIVEVIGKVVEERRGNHGEDVSREKVKEKYL